jgi:hypothetical protein
MNTDAEKIILHIQLQAWDDLHEDEIQTALQTLREALSACQVKTMPAQSTVDFTGAARISGLPSSQILAATLLPTTLLEALECLQGWASHHIKQYCVHVKAQCDDYMVESRFPLSFHSLDDWFPLYRRYSR